ASGPRRFGRPVALAACVAGIPAASAGSGQKGCSRLPLGAAIHEALVGSVAQVTHNRGDPVAAAATAGDNRPACCKTPHRRFDGRLESGRAPPTGPKSPRASATAPAYGRVAAVVPTFATGRGIPSTDPP